MILPSFSVGRYQRINTAGTTLVGTGSACLLGIFVSAKSGSPSVIVRDGVNQIAELSGAPLTAGQFYQMPFRINSGLVVVTTGAVDLTVSYLPI